MADLAQLLLILQEPEAGADDFTRVVEAPGIELLLYEFFKMTAQGNAGRHGGVSLTVSNR